MKADRMRIDAWLQTGRQRLGTRFGQDLVACAARPEGAGQGILHRIRGLEAIPQPLRSLALAVPKHISEVLRVGVEAEVGETEIRPEHVAFLDDLAAFQHAFLPLPDYPE